MARSASGLKRHRQSLRRRERNRARQTVARSSVRQAREQIETGTQEEAQAAVRVATSILDRAARRRVIHPNTAARRKSRLMRQLNAMQAPTGEAAPAKRRTRTTTKARATGTKAKTSARKTPWRSTRSKKS